MSPAEYEALAALAGKKPLDILNTKGPAYRSLKPKPGTGAGALDALLANPRVMIRPVLAAKDRAVFGFDEEGFHNLVTG